jgi:hypothetical protein
MLSGCRQATNTRGEMYSYERFDSVLCHGLDLEAVNLLSGCLYWKWGHRFEPVTSCGLCLKRSLTHHEKFLLISFCFRFSFVVKAAAVKISIGATNELSGKVPGQSIFWVFIM